MVHSAGDALLKADAVEAMVSRLRQEPATGGELIELGVKNGLEADEVPTVLEILIHNNVVWPCRSGFRYRRSFGKSAAQRCGD